MSKPMRAYAFWLAPELFLSVSAAERRPGRWFGRAIQLAAGVLYNFGILLSPAVGAVLMAASTVVVAINARFLRVSRAGGS